MLPPIPPWDGMHPLIVHFPIALLLVVPVILAASVVFDRHFRVLALVALVLIAMGTTAAFVAKQSGEAAVQIADIPDNASDVLEAHEHLADLTIITFGTMLGLYAAFVGVAVFAPKITSGKVRIAISALFFALYAGGSGLIANTAHAGGRLVHQYGIRNTAAVEGTASPATLPSVTTKSEKESD